MDTHTFTILSLCAGVEGIELGIKLNFPNSCTICHVEIEAYVCALLEKRMEEQIMVQAPVWTNLRTFDGKPWCGIVDCVCAGYPCQPFSIAGKKLGDKDPRHLWPEVARVVREVQPTFCFFENVGAHLRMGFEQVHDELLSMGYKVASSLFTASEIGAPHKRERLFILAYSPRLMRERNIIERIAGWQSESSLRSGSFDVADDNSWRCDSRGYSDPERPIHSNGFGITQNNQDRRKSEFGISTNSQTMADSDSNRCNSTNSTTTRENDPERWAKCLEDALSSGIRFTAEELSGYEARLRAYEEQSELQYSQDVLADTSLSRARKYLGKLWERLKGNGSELENPECDRRRRRSDGVDGWHSSQTQIERSFCSCDSFPLWPPKPNDYNNWETVPADFKPAVHRMADGLANRLDRVRTCGNGVVPLVAAYAFRVLFPDIEHVLKGDKDGISGKLSG